MAQKGRRIYVLQVDGVVLDVWSNLKHLCTDMNEQKNQQFISYSKLSKMDKKKGILIFKSKEGINYQIIIKILK